MALRFGAWLDTVGRHGREARSGAKNMLDVWLAMPHDFQAVDSTLKDTAEALARIAATARHAGMKETQ